MMGVALLPAAETACRSRSVREDPLTRFAKLAIAATVATYVLISVGGLVRSTDSGLGCPDWPLCFGQWVPPPDLHAWIEHTHRLIAALAVGPLVASVGIWTLVRRRSDRPLLAAAVVAGVLVIVQSLLGAAVVLRQLQAELVSAHMAMALTVFVMLLFIAERAVRGPLPRRSARKGLTALAGLAALLVFGQMVLGSWVTGSHSGLAFTDFPLMNGQLIPAIETEHHAIHFAHRALGGVLLALVVVIAWRSRAIGVDAATRRLADVGVALMLVQVVLGGANVWSRLSALFVVPHLMVGAALLATTFLVWLGVRRVPVEARVTHGSAVTGRPTPTAGDTLRAYIALTKPRIIELLLITTVPTMVLAQRGLPPLWLIAATVVGGALAAGGANAINQYVDRDIDGVMRRTRHRPLPRHAVTPREALVFGIGLSVVSVAWLAILVNPLAALLAASAIVFYVFVYTMWLKRSTPQNIVIGGAAGCVPVLVAWAAVTGQVGIPALVLFGIVFYWTPPHFWALALRYRGDYETARVPMLPVVRGEAETARQIVLYTLVLITISLLLLPAAQMGLIYGLAAVALGGGFLLYAVNLLRNAGDGRAAMRLFRYSISYLTLLFAAIAVDSLIHLPLA
jgi:heme o synthase